MLTTPVPLEVLKWAERFSAAVSDVLTAASEVLMAFFLLRVLVLMHEAGHGCLFRAGWLNRPCGMLFGVVCGMPATAIGRSFTARSPSSFWNE